jgi:sugar phosphate isomerase/epimerase
MLSRRSFFTRSATAIAASITLPSVLTSLSLSCSNGHRLKNIGFISGIIGKELEGEWKTVLKKAAEFGYTEMETGDYMGDSAASFLAYCKSIGVTIIAGGVGFNASDDETLRRLDALKDLGASYAVSYWPWLTGGPFSLADCKRSADILNNLGFLCKQRDLTLCWHNHDKEFISFGEGIPFDYLMKHTDPDLVRCEMDVYWVKKGGGNPLEVLKTYVGRIPILHVKDMASGPEQDFECPGSGIIDFPVIFSEALAQGIAHYMVERDNVPDGMACLQSAGEYLRNLRF